jgi:hypothetical protein
MDKCENCKCKDCFIVAIAACCDTCQNGNEFTSECEKYQKYDLPIFSPEEEKQQIFFDQQIDYEEGIF